MAVFKMTYMGSLDISAPVIEKEKNQVALLT